MAADDGVGIPPSIGRRVFAPFVTGSSARPAGEGTGLGLSIVKNVLELHKARYGVESAVGRGSTFWFELPISEEPD